MLLKLYIKDFALIDEIEVNFKEGLNILTGETGAGKSIIIDAINMVIGERASSEYIRTGKEVSLIEAIFEFDNKSIDDLLNEYGIEKEDNLLIIQREITEQGRSFCRVNGKSVTVSVLKKISKHLIDIHGQHQHQSLLDSESHIKFIDLLGGTKLQQVKQDVENYYHNVLDIEKNIKNIKNKFTQFNQQKEQLRYEIDEIEKANLKIDEDIMLREQKLVLENSEKIFNALAYSYALLYQGSELPSITENLGTVINSLEDIEDCYEPIKPQLDFLKNTLYELEEVAFSIRNYKESIDFDTDNLNQIQSRLEFLDTIKAKYQMNIPELLKYKEEACAKLDEYWNIEDELNKLTSELNSTKEKLTKKALALHNLRKNIALKLESDIANVLNDLGMKDVKFSVSINWEEVENGLCVNGKKFKIKGNGFDVIEFLISTNPGEPLKPLTKIVSGGETSRIMLALKTILAKIDKIPCLIFDEIDTGIGGKIAQIVGIKLSNIAKNHQVLCVTHSPQIASLGDVHFLIKKESINGKTYTSVSEIKDEDRVFEIARMLGGVEITSFTLAHAKEMIKMAKEIKN